MESDWKPLDKLVPADLERTPVWAYSFRGKSVGPNEGIVRPLRQRDTPDETIVRTLFHFADGSIEVGYCFPREADVRERPGPLGDYDRAVGWMTPAVVTPTGPVPFWLVRTARPTEADVAPYYARLGRSAADVFPLEFAADVPLDRGEIASGVVSGFHFLVLPRSGYELVTIM